MAVGMNDVGWQGVARTYQDNCRCSAHLELKGEEEVASVRRIWQVPNHKELAELVILLGTCDLIQGRHEFYKGHSDVGFLILVVVQEELHKSLNEARDSKDGNKEPKAVT